MILAFFEVLLGFFVLGYSANIVVSGASTVAQHFGVSKFMIGFTVIAFGTSAPEMAVSAIAAYGGEANISIGNIVGSNIANTALILPLAGLFSPLIISSLSIKRDFPFVLISTLIVFALMAKGGLTRIDAGILFAIFIILSLWYIRTSRRKQSSEIIEELQLKNYSMPKATFYLVIGLALLGPSAYVVLDGAKALADYFQISHLFIGLFMTAVGTSLPELATTVVSLIRKEKGILIGNLLGSNLFNLLIALPVAVLVQPIKFSPIVFVRDMPVLIGITILLIILLFVGKQSRTLDFKKAFLILLIYSCYIGYITYAEKLM